MTSLIKSWEKWDKSGFKSAVVLIDEPIGFGGDPILLRNQGAILQLVDQFQHAIACFIELNPTGGNTWAPTLHRLVDSVSVQKRFMIPKQYFSAFDDTTLFSLLLNQHVDVLVVMGHLASHCVQQSIYGGPRREDGPTPESRIRRMGAVDYDYTVLTSQSVVSGSIVDANWPKHPRVFIYER